jgi:hypothetical protein
MDHLVLGAAALWTARVSQGHTPAGRARRYTDQSFDQEFFTVLQRASLQYIRSAGSATLDDIATALREKARPPCIASLCLPAMAGPRGRPARSFRRCRSRQYSQVTAQVTASHTHVHTRWGARPGAAQGISTVELRDEDVLAVLRTLEYDGGVECGRGAGEDDEDVFRERRLALPEYAAPTSFPCGVCKARARAPCPPTFGRLACAHVLPQRRLQGARARGPAPLRRLQGARARPARRLTGGLRAAWRPACVGARVGLGHGAWRGWRARLRVLVGHCAARVRGTVLLVGPARDADVSALLLCR